MASNPHLVPCNSLVYSLTFLVTWLHLTAALIVHLKYSSHNFEDHSMPREINVTLTGESGAPISLQLRLAQSTDPNVPVYTFGKDQSGEYTTHLEELEDNRNVAYYQDLSSEAVIQVTRTDGREDNEGSFELKGELTIEGRQFTLHPEGRYKRETPLNPSSQSKAASYTLLSREPSRFATHDYVDAPPEIELKVVESVQQNVPDLLSVLSSHNKSLPSPSQSRQRRAPGTVQHIFVDVVAVIDFACYSRFSANSRSRNETLHAIREYYAFIFNGVDLRYKGIGKAKYAINVRLTKLYIAETSAMSAFTEQFRLSSFPLDEIDAKSALNAFTNFVVGKDQNLLSPHDHAVLFTGYELTTIQDGVVFESTAGLAYLSSLCRTDGKSVSVIEDHGGFQSVSYAAHELGHSLSAKHDGDGNYCRSTDGFIMSPGGSPYDSSNTLNPWLFSNCSIASFIDFIDNKLETVHGAKCLLEHLPTRAVPDVSDVLPGQKFSADEQCRMIHGNISRLCRGYLSSPSLICTSMYCADVFSSGETCFQYRAARGTTCGNGKMCLNGKCVSDPRAPSVDDNCVYGDQPGIISDSYTCSNLAERHLKNNCYQTAIRRRCCDTCKTVFTNIAGASNSSCLDNRDILINNLPCPLATKRYPSMCLDEEINDLCCSSCRKARSFIPD